MCKLGDIIIVDKYIGEDGKIINKHSFIVIEDKNGCISGLDYDFVATVISSFKSSEHKKKKLSYKENMEIKNYYDMLKRKEDVFRKESYVKTNQLFYFNKNKINYYLFGKVKQDYLIQLINLINELSEKKKVTNIIDNL